MKNILIVGLNGVTGRFISKMLIDNNNYLSAITKNISVYSIDLPNHINYIESNVLHENPGCLQDTCYDYIIIDGESSEFNGEDELIQLISNIISVINEHTKIGFISQSFVSQENTTVEKANNLYKCEQLLIKQKNPYIIFKPSLYMEVLPFFIRGNQATLIKDQKYAIHWISGEEVASLVMQYTKDGRMKNKTVYLYGPEQYTFEEALSVYSSVVKPNVRFDRISMSMFKSFAMFSNNNQLKEVADKFEYIISFKENGAYQHEKDSFLHEGRTYLEDWAKKFIKN